MTVFYREWLTRAGQPAGGGIGAFRSTVSKAMSAPNTPTTQNKRPRTRKRPNTSRASHSRARARVRKSSNPKGALDVRAFRGGEVSASGQTNHRHYEDGVRYCLTVLLPCFGSTLISQITPFDIETFKQGQMARESKRSKTGEKIKNKTINNYLDCLSGTFTAAIAEGIREDNPVDSVMRLEVEEIEKRVLSR